MSPTLSKFNLTKSTVEKYVLREIPKNLSWATFTIDSEDGSIQIQSDWGEYSYRFGAPGPDFKRFLRKLGSDYLLNKMADQNWYDGESYKQSCIRGAGELYLDNDIDLEQYKELITIFNSCIDFSYSKDMAQTQINDQELINKVTGGEWWYSFGYESDYRPQAKTMFLKVFPVFQAVLNAELEDIDLDLSQFDDNESWQPKRSIDTASKEELETLCEDWGVDYMPNIESMTLKEATIYIKRLEEGDDLDVK